MVRERPTFLLKSLVHTTLSLSLSLVKTTLHNAIKRTRTHRFYFEFLFLKENIGSTLYVKRHFVFRSPYTLSVFCYFLVSFEEQIGGDIMKSFRFKRKAFFLFLFFLYVCVCVCMSVFTSVAVSTGFTSKMKPDLERCWSNRI